MKPFKTYQEQVDILRDRGLDITDDAEAIAILERENYYGVINGYKDFFLKRDGDDNLLEPEVYKDGAKFEEIHKLFSFDRDLRNTLLEYLLKFETNLKAKISYRFSEKYGEPHAYLILKNYSRDSSKLKEVLKLISTISNTISNRGNSKNPISHYLNQHDGVPLWVLVNYLTLGNMQHFYTCLVEPLRNVIAKDFALAYHKNYSERIHFTPDMLENILKASTFFRNVCAHEERLYNFKIRKPARSADVASVLNVSISKIDKGNLFSMVAFLKMVSPKEEYFTLISRLHTLYDNYSTAFTSANFDDIWLEMGFDQDWKTNLLNE